MDDIVKAALKKWPHVPHCFGWLALDARGDWYMRDDRIQHAGPFPRVKGSRIDHEKLKDFIARNYEADAHGRWFFQNGPQRVYVQLETTPWVWRLQWRDGQMALTSHTGRSGGSGSGVKGCWLDDEGRLYLDSPIGIGLVHTQDMLDAAQAVEQGLWLPQPISADALPRQFGFVREPQPD